MKLQSFMWSLLIVKIIIQKQIFYKTYNFYTQTNKNEFINDREYGWTIKKKS